MNTRTLRRWLALNIIARRRIATTVGAVMIGLVAFMFAKAADLAQHSFNALTARQHYIPLLLTPLGFALLAFITKTYLPAARGSGIPQIIAAARHPLDPTTKSLISLKTAGWKMVLTVLALLCGASVGREGPTVQVSAAILVASQRVARARLTPAILIAGGAAGVSAAFNTPLAGVAFAIEELASAYEQRLAVLAMAAVMIAGFVSQGLEGDYIYFGSMHAHLATHAVLMAVPIAGIAGGALGASFSLAMLHFARSSSRAALSVNAHPIAFATGCGLLVALLGIATHGATWGTGYDAARAMVESRSEAIWFAPAKFLATLATSLSGIAGGIFAPSLAVGAGVGNIIAQLFPTQPAGAIVVLGMIAYFVGVVRAPLTGVIIVSEMTDSRALLLPLFATALLADGVSALICRERLYHGLSKGFGK